jgi:hypothetical protein
MEKGGPRGPPFLLMRRQRVLAGHSRRIDGVASLAYAPAILAGTQHETDFIAIRLMLTNKCEKMIGHSKHLRRQ